MTIAELVIELRETGLTERRIADHLGIREQTLWRWKTCKGAYPKNAFVESMERLLKSRQI